MKRTEKKKNEEGFLRSEINSVIGIGVGLV